MNFFDLCIQRPVMTLMMTFSVILFGVMGYRQLGVDQYPNMEFPIVTVTAVMEGAGPEVMEEDVTDVLEEFINTISGLRNLSSQTQHGVAQLIVEFDLSKDINIAAQDIRDKISLASRDLPLGLEPPVVQKVDMTSFPVVWIPVITERRVVDTSEYVRLQLKPQLETIPGVGAVEMFGRLDRNIRIWLDGDAMRARGLAATDILSALRREHVEVPGGRVISDMVEYSVKTDAQFDTLAALERLVIRNVDGVVVRLVDVARVEDGSEDSRVRAYFDGLPTVGAGVLKQPGGNTVSIADELYERLRDLSKSAPSGIAFGQEGTLIDFSLSIREAVAETQFALILGAVLATLTVFVFLRRWRPTMIVGAAIPLSLVGTFGAMWIFGFTLNVMTLLALALAVGVVIDDAIVVLENIERHRENGEGPFQAASRGTREIAFAATAATVSIAAVFLPVVFVTGIVGNFLAEFGGTVASAVMISLFIALTLTPMLAARMPPPQVRAHGSIYHRLELGFEWLERNYRDVLHWTLEHRGVTVALALAALVSSCGFGSQLGTEFFPPADEGRMLVRLELPPGSSVDSTRAYQKKVETFIMAQPEVAGLFEGIGLGGPDGPGTPNQGIMFTILKPRADRERSAQELMRDTRKFLATLPGRYARVFDMAMSPGGGDADFEFNLRGNLDLVALDSLADEFIRELEGEEGIIDLHKSLKLGLPEIRVVPDREKAAALGVDATSLATTVSALIGGMDVGTFKESGQGIDIRIRLEAEERDTPDSIRQLYVRASDGSLVEVGNLASIETGAAPSVISRTNRRRNVTIRGNLEGRSLGEAVAVADRIAARILPEGMSLEVSGEAESMQESVADFGTMLVLSIVVIYMVLAAQFESFIHPLTVMLALPLAMVGALGGLYFAGMTINLFSMIGIILLLGLVTKNSILLVDYAIKLREGGMDKRLAMETAAPVRMRPVLMTAFSMIFGVLPAALGIGPGSETRAPMGVATAAGMFSSTLLTLLVIPTFYLLFDDAAEWVKGSLQKLAGKAQKTTAELGESGLPDEGT